MKALNNECAREAVNFIYKHGGLTYGSAYDAIQLLTSNGFAIYRTDGDEQVVYTDPDGKMWHPHRGYWCWKVSHELAQAQKRIKELEAEPAPVARSSAVKVKALEWHRSEITAWDGDWHSVPTAYTVRCADENGWKWSSDAGFGYECSDIAAKAAAQADYEQRILSALEPAEPATLCVGCEGNPSSENNPCAVCGKPAEPATDAEPVAVLEFARKKPGNENEMPRVVSCNWLPDGQYAVYTHPPESRLREALGGATVGRCGSEVTIYCNDSGEADKILDLLILAQGADDERA